MYLLYYNMLFCNTPYQSVFVAIFAGLLGGLISILTGKPILTLLIAGFVALIMEFSLHEIRQDNQYQEAKEEVISYINN